MGLLVATEPLGLQLCCLQHMRLFSWLAAPGACCIPDPMRHVSSLSHPVLWLSRKLCFCKSSCSQHALEWMQPGLPLATVNAEGHLVESFGWLGINISSCFKSFWKLCKLAANLVWHPPRSLLSIPAIVLVLDLKRDVHRDDFHRS